MKKLIFLFFILIVLNTFGQKAKDNTFVINLGGPAVKIPAPTKQFIEAGPKQRAYFSSFEPLTISMHCVFIDTADYRKIVIEKNDTIVPDKYFLVESIKKHETSNCTLKEFEEIRKGVTELLTKDMTRIIDTVGYIVKQPSDLIRDVNLERPNSIGCIYDTKDACGILQLSIFKYEYKTRRMMRTLNYILIKNRVILLYVNYLYDGTESIKQIIRLSKNWTKAIIEKNN